MRYRLPLMKKPTWKDIVLLLLLGIAVAKVTLFLVGRRIQ